MTGLPKTLSLCCGLLLLTSCAEGTIVDGDWQPPSDDAVALEAQALLSGKRTVNQVLKLAPTAPATDVELRQWWEPTAPLLRRIPKNGVVVLGAASPKRTGSSGPEWYQVAHAGTWGWIRATELVAFHKAYPNLSRQRRDALALARSAMGFSYWWSNARWKTSGPTIWPTKNVGACEGTCGDADGCEHEATPRGATEYGSDCSGLVSTVWGFPDSDASTNPTHNGYQTSAYATDRRNEWSTVELDDALPGDAIIKYDTQKKTGHVALVAQARTARGQFKTYECEGCASGCRARNRSVPNANDSDVDIDWHAIRRHGWAAN